MLLGSWAGVTLLVPTVMRTKLPWYLNPFYPVFALGIAWLLVKGLSLDWSGSLRRRGVILAAVIVLVLGVAEGKLIWYSYQYRDLGDTAQGMLLQERTRLKDRRVFFDEFGRGDIFVAGGVVGAAHQPTVPLERILAREPSRRLSGFRRPTRRPRSRTGAHRTPPVALLPPRISLPLANHR